MDQLKCREPACRENLVKNYNIIPRAYTKLLKGQIKRSCTSDLLEDKYFTFEYINKTDSNDKGTFFCGSHAAKHFFQLLNMPRPKLFNPLSEPTLSNSNTSTGTREANTSGDPTATELLNAINLLIICWNSPIKGDLAEYKANLEKSPSKKPHYKTINHVNNILGRDAKKRSLTQMLEELRKKNPSLRQYTFNNLNIVLNQRKKNSNF